MKNKFSDLYFSSYRENSSKIWVIFSTKMTKTQKIKLEKIWNKIFHSIQHILHLSYKFEHFREKKIRSPHFINSPPECRPTVSCSPTLSACGAVQAKVPWWREAARAMKSCDVTVCDVSIPDVVRDDGNFSDHDSSTRTYKKKRNWYYLDKDCLQ